MTKLLPFLRLLRAGTLFSPAGDVVAGACVLAAATAADAVWTADIVRAVAASVLIYGAGMVWNDVADVAEDRRQRPERPIPSGAVSRGTAAALGGILLLVALLLSPPGYRHHHGLVAALVLAYDWLLKRIDLAGALAMALLRALNLATAAAPLWAPGNPAPSAPPTPLLAAAACYGVYIAAVTILGIFEDRGGVRPRAVVAIQLGPVVAAFTGLVAVQGGWWPAPLLGAVPMLWFARRNRGISHWDAAAIRRSMTLLLLGTMLYTSLLCAASLRWAECAGIAAAIPLARAVTRRLLLRTMS